MEIFHAIINVGKFVVTFLPGSKFEVESYWWGFREVRSSISGSSRFAFEQQNLRKLHNFCLNLTEGSEFGSVFWYVRFLNMIQVGGS